MKLELEKLKVLEMSESRKKQTLIGTVISAKMEKTVSCACY